LRTVAAAIDFIGSLQRASCRRKQDVPIANILVVDDEAISRRAVTYALEKAKLKSVNVESSLVAYNLCPKTNSTCFSGRGHAGDERVRAFAPGCARWPAHKKTPVVFVTSLNDFESRATRP